MTKLEGHLFVVHGKIESVIHDAALIPVGQEYRFNPIWRSLVGENPPLPNRWQERGFGRIKPAPDRVWAVSVGGRVGDDYDLIVDRIVGALGRVDKFRGDHDPKRSGSLPLVAVPVIGIGRGGHGSDRGAVVRTLVRRLTTAARELRLDVVLVTPDPAVFAAAQYARKTVSERLPDRLELVALTLGARARNNELALLLGAGVSAAAGLPTWHSLISGLAEDFRVVEPPNVTDLTPTDRAELIERVADGRFQARIAERASEARWPSLLHALLAGLDCHEVVTTNYDVLYEEAVRGTGRDITTVMPWASAQGAERWILKLHGDVTKPRSIVLTRRHMLRYDAANRPSAAVLQSLLLTKHLLAVGVSMTDDNVIRLAYEVQEYRKAYQGGGSGPFGSVLDADGDRLRSQLWEGQLEWVDIPALGPWPDRRGLELLLDRIAFHAASDSSWLLDERFDGLLQGDEERRIARDVREMYRRIPKREGNKWWPLIQCLERFGASSGEDRRGRENTSTTSRIPPARRCGDFEEFLGLMLNWLERTDEQVIGDPVESPGPYIAVDIGSVRASLLAGATREGVAAFVRAWEAAPGVAVVADTTRFPDGYVSVGGLLDPLDGFSLRVDEPTACQFSWVEGHAGSTFGFSERELWSDDETIRAFLEAACAYFGDRFGYGWDVGPDDAPYVYDAIQDGVGVCSLWSDVFGLSLAAQDVEAVRSNRVPRVSYSHTDRIALSQVEECIDVAETLPGGTASVLALMDRGMGRGLEHSLESHIAYVEVCLRHLDVSTGAKARSTVAHEGSQSSHVRSAEWADLAHRIAGAVKIELGGLVRVRPDLHGEGFSIDDGDVGMLVASYESGRHMKLYVDDAQASSLTEDGCVVDRRESDIDIEVTIDLDLVLLARREATVTDVIRDRVMWWIEVSN